MRWRHVKRGSVYQEIGRAQVQADTFIAEGETLMVYRGPDGQLWARPQDEFLDGRFVKEET